MSPSGMYPRVRAASSTRSIPSANAATRSVLSSLSRALGHLAVGPAHDPLQPAVHLVLVPAEVLEVLHPLEVGHHHAAGVGQHVGHHQHALVHEDLVARGVAGLLAPSTTTRQRSRSALSAWIMPPSAAGTNRSHSRPRRSSGVDRFGAGHLRQATALADVAQQRAGVDARPRTGSRRWRLTRRPSSRPGPAGCARPTSPRCRSPGPRSGSRPGPGRGRGAASRNEKTTPRPVAASRP